MKFCSGCYNDVTGKGWCFYHEKHHLEFIQLCPCKECILKPCCSYSCEKWEKTNYRIIDYLAKREDE